MKKCHCCKDKTISWGIIEMNYYCRICRDYRKDNGNFPDKKKIKILKEEGLWK